MNAQTSNRPALPRLSPRLPFLDRFWRRVAKAGPDDCWPWIGARKGDGYGIIMLSRKKLAAHRVAWEIANDRSIPTGLVVCHTCDNPPCVNPAHLWVGTHADNARDMVAKGRHGHAIKTHCPRGHEYTPENTAYRRGKTNRNCLACSRAYYLTQRRSAA